MKKIIEENRYKEPEQKGISKLTISLDYHSDDNKTIYTMVMISSDDKIIDLFTESIRDSSKVVHKK